jgi:hypothetical protein
MSDTPQYSEEDLERARAVLAYADRRTFHLDPTLPEPVQVQQALEQALALTGALSNETEWMMHSHGLRT